MAIDREEINKTLYFGLATPRSYTVPPGSEYCWQGYEVEEYIKYDVEQANKLLDEIGLDKKDNEGFRLRPDGKRPVIVLEATADNLWMINLVTMAPVPVIVKENL